MLHRVATIVTAFRATGILGVRTSIKTMTTIIAGANRVINNLGAGLNTVVFKNLTAIIVRLGAAARSAGGYVSGMAKTLAGGAGLLGAGKLAVGAAFVKKAADDTQEDLMPLRRMASLLNLPIQTADAFRIYAEKAGVAMEDLNPIIAGMAAAIASAADPTTDMGKMFAQLQIPLRKANGDARNMLDIMLDLGKATSRMNAQQRNAVLNPIFGDDDSLKVSEFLQKIAVDGPVGIAQDAQRSKDKGLLVTDDDIALNKDYQSSLQAIGRTWKVLKRELFNVFQPVIVGYLDAINRFLTKLTREKIIEKFFINPFNRLADVLSDVLKVFFGIDGAILKIVKRQVTYTKKGWLAATIEDRWFGEIQEGMPLKFPWLVEVRDGLKTLMRLATEFVALLGKLAIAGKDFAHALNEATRNSNGDSVWQQFKDLDTATIGRGLARAGEAVKAFARDVRSIAGAGAVDPASLETGLARGLVAAGAKVKEMAQAIVEPLVRRFDELYARITPVFDAIRNYVVAAWSEATRAMASGEGLKGVESALGQVLYLSALLVHFLGGIVKAMEAIAVGQPIDPAFRWVESVYNGLVYLKDVVVQLVESMKPLFRVLDGLSNLIFGVHFVVLLLIGKALAPLFRMFGSIYGAIAKVATWLRGSFLGLAFKASFDAARLAGAGLFTAITAGFQGMLVAAGAFVSAIVTVLGPWIAALSLIVGLISAATAAWKIWQMRKQDAANEAVVDNVKQREAFDLNNALKRNGGSLQGFNPGQVEYMRSAQFQRDLAATPQAKFQDGTEVGRKATPVKLYFGNEEIGDLSGTDDQIDRLSRSADQAIAGY